MFLYKRFNILLYFRNFNSKYFTVLISYHKNMILLLLLVSTCILLLYYYWRLHTYWSRRNVPCSKFSFFGNSRNASMLKITATESLQMTYKQYEGYPFVGIYELITPVLLLRDPKLIKYVFVKDFAYFQSKLLSFHNHTSLQNPLFLIF